MNNYNGSRDPLIMGNRVEYKYTYIPLSFNPCMYQYSIPVSEYAIRIIDESEPNFIDKLCGWYDDFLEFFKGRIK